MLKDMKFDNFGYHGEVEVGLIKDGKKIKRFSTNLGTINLFRYICGCLSGEINPDYSINKRPGCIRLYAGTKSILGYGIKFEDVMISEVVDKKPDGKINQAGSIGSVTYTFLIPGTVLVNKQVNKVRLMPLLDSRGGIITSDNEDDYYYAEASFAEPIVTTDMDANIYVAWTLTVRNLVKEN